MVLYHGAKIVWKEQMGGHHYGAGRVRHSKLDEHEQAGGDAFDTVLREKTRRANSVCKAAAATAAPAPAPAAMV